MKHFYGNLQKVIFFIALLTLCPFLLKAQTFTLQTVDAGPYAPGSSIAVPFKIDPNGNCIKPDNVFKLYISSVPGGTPDRLIGSYTGFYTTFINGTIPTDLAAGNGYNIAITSSDAPATSTNTATVDLIAGNSVQAKITGAIINSTYPDAFGNCSGNGNTYNFSNASTSGSTVSATVFNDLDQTGPTSLTFNPTTQNASFAAAKANYTIFVKAVYNGVEGTRAYQLINNRISSNFGTTSGDPVCLTNGQGTLTYSIATSSIQGNYPGNLYTVDWGDGTSSQYTLCDLLLINGQLSHTYTRSSCGTSSGTQINSFPVNAQVSSLICGTLGSPITSYAKVITKPTNSLAGPLSACLNIPVTFTNTSDPGQDASSANCVNNNALYTWYVDGDPIAIDQPLSASFTYTFTTSGNHQITLQFESQSNTVCPATDYTYNICVLAKPQPAFSLTASTICSNNIVSPTDHSITDQSCASIPQNNVYTWSVSGPGSAVFINSTTSASHNPQIQFSSPGVYTLTLSIATESCGAVSTSQTITVNTSPTVTLSPDFQTCGTNKSLTFSNANGSQTQVIFTGTTTDQPNTYSWTVSGGNYGYQNGTNSSSKYPQIVFTNFATYTVTATQTNNCGSASTSQQITFLQSPTVNAGPNQTICPADVVQLAGTISDPQPQSYQWVGGNDNGFSPNRFSLNATYTPTSTEVDAGQVRLTLVAITGYPSPCDQLSDEVIITINPRNAVTSSSTSMICTGATVGYHPTAQIPGSTFTWTSTASTNISGNTTSGSGDINDALTNSDPFNNGVATYTITPISNSCPGTSFTLTVTVTPRPVITVNSTTNTICSGQSAGITFTSNLSGTTFRWTSTATAGISGNNNQTAINATGITDVLNNSSTTNAGTATYTIAPIGPTGCEGTPVTVTITVQALPVVANAGTDAPICAAASYTLNGNDPGVSSGVWTLRSGQAGVTFANANQYNTVVNGLQAGNIYTFRWTITGAAPCSPTFAEVSINDLSPLTNNINFGSPAVCYGQTITITGDQPTGGNGTYVYSWQSSNDNSNWTTVTGQNGRNYSFTGTQSIYIRRIVSSLPCSDISQPVYVIVQQAITANTISADQQICYNTMPTLLNGNTPAGGDGNFSYQWQSSVNNGTTWNTISGANNINYQPVALTVTTQFQRIVNTALCTNAQQSTSNSVTITVNPQNTNTVTSAASSVICTGTTFNYHPTAQSANTSFTWVSSASASVNGNSPSGSGDISDVLTNTDPNNDGTVTYTITPVNNSCPGTPFTLTVTVTPRPIITVNTTSNTICSGQPTGITFTANLTGTTFRWTNTATSNIYGNNNQAAVAATRIDDVLTNTSATASGTVTYTITPVSPSGCEGAPVTVTVTVQPLPVQANAGTDEQICSTTSYTLNGNDPGVSSGNWTVVSGQTGISFTNPALPNTTVNGLQPGQNYTFRWTITGAAQCAVNSDDVVISVLQDLTNNISFGSPAVCYGQTITITGGQPTGGTGTYVYSWESSTDNANWTTLNGQSGGNLSTLLTSSVYFRRIVTSGPCTKISNSIYILVQPPISNNTITADQQICYNNAPTLLYGSTPAGADGNFIYQWQQSSDNGANWNTINGATSFNYQPIALITTTQFRRIVSTALCTNGQQNISNAVTITVTPQNTNMITSDASRTICTGTTMVYHPTAQAANTSFTWVSSASASVAGNTPSGTGDISDILTNSDSNNNGTVTYTITPVNNSCPGIPFTLTVTVTPRPIITVNSTSNTICSGQPAGITFTSNLSGTVFKWTATASAGISGSNNQATLANVSGINDVLTNASTTAAGNVTYQITPVGPSGCEGTPVTVTITVQPLPLQANAGNDEQVCSTTSYVLNGNDPGVSAGTWTLVSGQTGVSFTDPTLYNTTANGLQPAQVYTFRWTITGAAQCAANSDDVLISDLQELTNNISFGSQAVCNGQTVTITGDQPSGGTNSYVYSWESSTDNINWTTVAGQNGFNYSFTAVQNSYLRRIVTSGPCTKISQPVYIIVQPPIANNTVTADQLVCYNTTPTSFTGSTPTGADGNFFYQWQSSNDNGATWLTISGATAINYQPVALVVTTQFRRIVTTALCNGGQGNSSTIVTVIVDPQNTNNVTSASTQNICTGTSLNYVLTAQQPNTSFTWVSSASASVAGNSPSGSGNINDLLTNADPSSNGTVTYTITPINNNCPGNPFTLTVTVTPRPVVTVNSTTNTICSGQPTGIAFTANLSGTVFKWTTTASNGISGNNNQQPVYASRIDDILTNSTTASGTATYTITPIGPTGCEGAPVIVTVTVEPQPLQANAGYNEQICAAGIFILKGNNPAPFTGRWTLTSGQTGVAFADETQYNTSVNGLQGGQQYTFRWTISGNALCASTLDDVVITDLQELTNTVSFANPAICFGQTATILGSQPTGGIGNFVYRWESSTDNINWTVISGQTNRDLSVTLTASTYFRRIVTSGPCVITSNSVEVIVQPALTANSITFDQFICYNTTPALLNGSTPAGSDGNYFYQWQQSSNNGTTWTNINGATSSDYQPGTLTTTTKFRRIVSSVLCSGAQQNTSSAVIVTVNPQNTNTVTSAFSQTICTGTTFSYHPTARQTNTSFTWVSSASGNISGNTVNGFGDISDLLVNSDPNNDGTVTYVITPNNNNCPGNPFTLTVTVTPLPVVTLINTGKEICSGNPTGIAFTTNLPGTLLKWTFDPVQGVYGSNTQYPVLATRIDDIITTDLTTPATIVYHITPISANGCVGTTVDATVTVLPQPVTANAGADEAICNSPGYTLKGNNPAPSSGMWTVTSGQTGVGFADATQSNTAVSGLLPGQDYTFRWTITSTGGCSTSTDDVVVSDLKDLGNNISFANPAVCFGQTITVTGDQPTGGNGSFVYSWESSTDNSTWTAIGGQTGRDLSFIGTKNIYVRRMVTSGPCTKISQAVYIIVQQPITNNTVGSDQEVCYNFAPKMLTGSTPAGADNKYFYQWQKSEDNGTTWFNIPAANALSYQVINLTVTTQFRRVVTSALCTGPQQSISNVIIITVNPLVNPTYTYTGDIGCIPYVLDANNIKATAAPGNATYTWYADGVQFGVGLTFPGYTIKTDNAQVVIKLVVTSKYGCPDASFTHTFSTIKEVTAGFTQDQTKGCGPLTATFTNTSNPQSQATYSWNFGNGSTSILVNPAPVTFLARTDGKDTTYNVTLKALTACGIRTAISTVTVRPQPISIFTPDKTVGCSPFTVNFNNTSPGTANTYTFDFGDGQTLVTTNNQVVSHTYTTVNARSYIIKMTAKNECGASTTQYTVRVSPNTVLPQLVVNGDQKAGCAPWTVNFHNNTVGGNYFTYDFGDGTIVNTLTAPEVVTHTFLKDGIYNIKLTATNGCSDTSTYESVTVFAQPVTSFTSDATNACTLLTVNFKNQTPGNNTYNWDFGDGGSSTLANPQHTYTASNTPFTVTLIAKNALGCADTTVMKDYIQVTFPPKAAFAARPDSVIVYPNYSFGFADNSTNNPILWKWSFGDGSGSSKQNPEHTYRDTGIYLVKLIVYDLQGCADSISHNVQITGTPGQLFVPNAFMPTSRFDELVTFKVKGSGLKTWRMRIFNKWGQVIWETTKLTARGEPAEGWDGMMNGAPAPQGVYIWQISGTYLNGNEWTGMSYNNGPPNRQGVIHLIR